MTTARLLLLSVPVVGWEPLVGFEPTNYQIDRSQELHVRKEGNVLFNDTLNTFYLQLYGVGHMVKDHSDSERGNPLPLSD